MQNPPHIFMHKTVHKSFSWFCCSFPDYFDQLKCVPNRGEFIVFLQLVEVIWETTANRGETLTQFCAEKYERVFALYCMKFDLALRKL